MKSSLLTILGMFFCLSFTAELFAQTTVKLDLKEYKRIDKPAREEVSGIVKDIRFENVFWVHGDSGTKNKVFPINSEGEVLPTNESEGLELVGIENKDWEDIAIDEKGNLIIADIGNNCSCRADQTIVFLKNPLAITQSSEDHIVYRIKYEKPSGFLYRFINYSMDVEAVFWKEGALYAVTKRFNGNSTKVFKLSTFTQDSVNEFKLVQELDFDDEVTGADHAFGKLAVLTYKSLWIFEDNDTEDLFDGEVKRYTFDADQVEAVTFIDSNTVLIAEENGELYKIDL